MAPVTVVSDATASIPSAGYNVPPIYYNGRVYVFLRHGTTNVAVYSATFDDTSGFGTFTEEDSSNRPGSGSTTITQIESLWIDQDPDNPEDVYVLVFGTVSGGNYQMEWSKFEMDNTTNDPQGSWSSIENAVLASTYVKSAGSNRGTISVRSDGDLAVLYSGPSDKAHGTDYARVYYTRYNGSTWSTPALVEGSTSDTVQYNFPSQVMGRSDLAHFFWYNGTNWRTRSFSSTDTLNTLKNIGSSYDNGSAKPRPAYYDNAGTEEIYWTHKASDGHPQYNLISGDGTPGSDTEMDDVAVYDQGDPWQETMQLGIDPTNGDLWLGYADSSTQDAWRVDDSGWGSATEVADGQTIEDLSVSVVETDEGAVCMLFLWQDDASSANEVEYYVITAASGDQTVTLTTTIASGESVPSPQLDLHITDAGNIASGEVVYAPDSIGTQTIADAGNIASGDNVYAPQLNLQIDAVTVASGEAVFSPQVDLHITDAGNITSGEAVFSPQVDLHIDAGTVASDENVYTPQLDLHITDAGNIASGETFYTLTISTEGGDQNITDAGNIASGESVYEPQVDLHIAAGTVTTSGQVYAPQLDLHITDAGNIASGEVVYSPQLDLHIDAGTVTTSESVYAPVVSLEGGDQTIADAGNISSGESVYTPTVIQEQFITITATIASGESVYVPELDLHIDAGTVATSEQVYAPQIDLHIDAGTVASGEAVYAPIISGAGITQTITIDDVIASGEVVYSLTVERGPILAKGNPAYENEMVTQTRRGEFISFDGERLTTFGRVKRGS